MHLWVLRGQGLFGASGWHQNEHSASNCRRWHPHFVKEQSIFLHDCWSVAEQGTIVVRSTFNSKALERFPELPASVAFNGPYTRHVVFTKEPICLMKNLCNRLPKPCPTPKFFKWGRIGTATRCRQGRRMRRYGSPGGEHGTKPLRSPGVLSVADVMYLGRGRSNHSVVR